MLDEEVVVNLRYASLEGRIEELWDWLAVTGCPLMGPEPAWVP